MLPEPGRLIEWRYAQGKPRKGWNLGGILDVMDYGNYSSKSPIDMIVRIRGSFDMLTIKPPTKT